MDEFFDEVIYFLRKGLPWIVEFCVWLWGPYSYPRWLRRTYIIFWPILMPLRWGFAIPFMLVLLLVSIFTFMYNIVSAIFEALMKLYKAVKREWTK
jgi:hypothetical protein